MPKNLFLESFTVRPNAYVVDLEGSTMEPVSLGEQKIRLVDLQAFAEDVWPMMWASLRAQFAEQEAAAGVVMGQGVVDATS